MDSFRKTTLRKVINIRFSNKEIYKKSETTNGEPSLDRKGCTGWDTAESTNLCCLCQERRLVWIKTMDKGLASVDINKWGAC